MNLPAHPFPAKVLEHLPLVKPGENASVRSIYLLPRITSFFGSLSIRPFGQYWGYFGRAEGGWDNPPSPITPPLCRSSPQSQVHLHSGAVRKVVRGAGYLRYS